MNEFIEVDDDQLERNTYYFVLTDSGKWMPTLLNIYNQWVVGDMFLPKSAFNGLRKIIVNMPPMLTSTKSE